MVLLVVKPILIVSQHERSAIKKKSTLINLATLMMSGLLSSGPGGKSSEQHCSFLHYSSFLRVQDYLETEG